MPEPPKLATTIQTVREHVRSAAAERKSIGLVPTMGALHAGHLSLVREARARCGFVVVSIFVNPIQFNDRTDLETYPRTLDEDMEALREIGIDLVFAPSPSDMYLPDAVTTVHVARLTEPLCGRHRPGHFDGVTTVVTKLFNIVRPDLAFFGQKDAQQAIVVRKMVEDLNFPVEIVTCPTVREADGLAMSSRNKNLSAEERERAPILSQALAEARRAIERGERDAAKLRSEMSQRIRSSGPCEIDYIEIVDPRTLETVDEVRSEVLIAVAARFGDTRLIDNALVDPSPSA